MENGRCALHGGKTPRGAASPHFKHGRYSKFADFPPDFAEKHDAARNDPDLLNLEHDQAVLLQYQMVALEQAASGGVSTAWFELMDAGWKVCFEAIEQGDDAALYENFRALYRIYQNGRDPFLAWEDAADIAVKRARVQSVLNRQEKDRQLMIPVAQAFTTIKALVASIMRFVPVENRADAAQEFRNYFPVIRGELIDESQD
ncbi:MAG: hypothetical protein KDE50_36225 [Caldilineaceae bacterium]|nr:hypothetical protein [Caldilineaceae bacterium]